MTVELSVVHLFAINESDAVPRFTDAVAPFHPVVLFEQPMVTVLAIRSGQRYEALESERHGLIDRDLDLLRQTTSVIGSSHPEIDGCRIGSRWPVVIEHGSTAPTSPEEVEIEVRWDNALLRRCSPDMEHRLLLVVAAELARYRILHRTITVCRELLQSMLQSTAPEGDGGAVQQYSGERQSLLAGRVLADARPDLYWGCEQTLLQQLHSAWSIDVLERAADDAVETTAVLWSERMAQRAEVRDAQQVAAARRTAVTIRLLTLLSGMSALAGLIDFGASGADFHWSTVRPLVSLALLVVFLGLLFVIRGSDSLVGTGMARRERSNGAATAQRPTRSRAG